MDICIIIFIYLYKFTFSEYQFCLSVVFMYKISIIIPVFNVKDCLDDAFNSIKNQTFGFENLEIIFIDDCSTDGSSEIIKDFSSSHSNVKAICLENNSGFAGKPRNVGIKNATCDYLMFLDPDDVFLADACSILYNCINKNHLDLVSGNYDINRDSEILRNNWSMLNLNDEECVSAKGIDDNFNFLKVTPSVWAKIFRKDFILENNIKFPEGVPAQDLVFVSHALLKANGIMFINKPVVEYIPRVTGENKSLTSKKSKSVLYGFIKAYTELYWIFFNHNKKYCWLAPRNLFFWIKQLSLSDVSIYDKVDLLYSAEFLFCKFLDSDEIHPPKFLSKFLDFIKKKDYLNAAILSNRLAINYKSSAEIQDSIINKNIYLLFFGMDINIGGLAKAVFNRANVMDDNGYDITLLNTDDLKNFNHIISYFKDVGYLNESIEFINMFDYYSKKNTLTIFNDNSKYMADFSDSFSIKNEFLIEKIVDKDKSIILNYYDNRLLKISDVSFINDEISAISLNSLIKSEVYMDNYLSIIKEYGDGNLVHESFFTKDGFNYISINYEGYKKFITLYDRKLGLELNFNGIFEFSDYFINEIILKSSEKPFIVNECSGIYPNFDNVDPLIAYKIASVHTNPYLENHAYGSPMRDIAALHDVHNLDGIVVLTNGLKNDLKKEFNIKNIHAVPNFLNFSKYPYFDGAKKDTKKISIFARLSSEKNISDAIKAFSMVVSKDEDARLEIFGRALKPFEINEEKKLRNLVKELKLENNVLFMGHVDNVYEEMSKSLATIFVSHFEGLGMVVLESLLNATPVVSYDIHYGPSDFIEHGENGFIVNQYDVESLAEHILKILDNPKKAIQMGINAQKRILSELNDNQLFLRWEKVFKEVYTNTLKNEVNNNFVVSEVFSNENNKDNYFKNEMSKLYKKHDDIVSLNSKLREQNLQLIIRNHYLENRTKVINRSFIEKNENSSDENKKTFINNLFKK